MAKRTMSWDWKEDGVLICKHLDATPEKLQSFNMIDIFPEWADMSVIQRHVIANGFAQKLGDSCARQTDEKLTVNERIVTLSNTWSRLLDGIWTQKSGDRNTLKKQIQTGLDELDQEAKDAIPEALKELLRKQGVKI